MKLSKRQRELVDVYEAPVFAAIGNNGTTIQRLVDMRSWAREAGGERLRRYLRQGGRILRIK